MRVEFIKQLHNFCKISTEDAQFMMPLLKVLILILSILLKHNFVNQVHLCQFPYLSIDVYGWLMDKIKSWPTFFYLFFTAVKFIVNGI